MASTRGVQAEVGVDEREAWGAEDLRRSRWAVRGRSVVALLVVLGVTAAGTAFSSREVDSQERKLLDGRASGIASELATVLAGIESSLDAVGTAYSAQGAAALQAAAGSGAGQVFLSGPTTSLAVVSTTGGSASVVATAPGGPLRVGDAIGPAAAAAISRAERADPSRILHMASTGLMNSASAARVGLAFHPVSFPAGQSLYLEIGVADFYALSPPQLPIITDLAVAVYSNPSADASGQLLSLNGAPLRHRPRVVLPATIGADDWSMLVQSPTSLIGRPAGAIPWMVAIGGVIAAVVIAALFEDLGRRRDYALALAAERTRELTASNELLSERAGAEALLRLAARDVSVARDLAAAFDRYRDTLAEVVPHGTATLSTVVDEQGTMEVVAAPTGAAVLPSGASSGIGRRWSARPFLTDLDDGRAVRVDGDPSEPDAPGRRAVVVPLVAAHQLRGAVAVVGSGVATFADEDLGFVERLTRETSGPLLQLIALDREREVAERLADLNQLKNDFIGMVAHDLRSPMTAITGFGQMLLQYFDELGDGEKREYIERIVEGGTRVTRFAEDVLEVARMDSGELRIDLTTFDLGDLVRTTAEEVAMANGRTCDIDVPAGLPQAKGDRERHWQVISNLVGNACKFSDPGTPVEVSMRVDGDRLRVDVRDHGIGMSQEDAAHVFDRFYRAAQPAGRQKAPGTGLGLFITRTLVEAQGGAIAVESEPGHGSVFTYTAPMADGSADGPTVHLE